jgi:hypothetical protein
MLVALIVNVEEARAASGWQRVEDMPTPRAFHASAVIKDRWHIAGGAAGSGAGLHFPVGVDVYDPANGHWTTIGELREGREYLRAVADRVGDGVLFSGGFTPAGADEYAPKEECNLASPSGAVSIAPLMSARYLHAAAFAAGKFIVTGGWGFRGISEAILDDGEAMHPGDRSWIPAGTMPAGPRAGHTMTTLQDGAEVLVVGGCRPDRAMAEVDRYDASTGRWSSAAGSGQSRCRHGAVLLSDGRVLVAG